MVDQPVPVTVDSFIRAETDRYLGSLLHDGAIGAFTHQRELASIDDQKVIRMNRDTVYSIAVVDLDAGPVTLQLPDSGKRFMSMQVIDQDHFTLGVFYDTDAHTFERGKDNPRYLAAIVRTLVDPTIPGDYDDIHSLQEKIMLRQDGPGNYEVPNWDRKSRDSIRNALLDLNKHTTTFAHAFGNREMVDPVYHLLGTAAGWGGNPDADAAYWPIAVPNNDGITEYTLTLHDVPVDGFWSVSVYNEAGYFEKNDQNAYTLNNLTAVRDENGAIPIRFGGCSSDMSNCLPIVSGWNAVIRLYRPRQEILDKIWSLPALNPAG